MKEQLKRQLLTVEILSKKIEKIEQLKIKVFPILQYFIQK